MLAAFIGKASRKYSCLLQETKKRLSKKTDLPIDRNRICQWENNKLNWAIPSEELQACMIEFINKGI